LPLPSTSNISPTAQQNAWQIAIGIQAYLGYCVTPSNYGHYPRIHRWQIVLRRAVGPRWHDAVRPLVKPRGSLYARNHALTNHVLFVYNPDWIPTEHRGCYH
jgi:hypothetical protein